MADQKCSEPNTIVIVQEEGGGMKEKELSPYSSLDSQLSLLSSSQLSHCPACTSVYWPSPLDWEFLEGRGMFYSSLPGL